MESFDYILTPTSPPQKCNVLIDSCITSILPSLSEINMSINYDQTDIWQPNKNFDNYCNVSSVNSFSNYSSFNDTPDSLFDTKQGYYNDDENYFKFDVDTIEKFMPSQDVLPLDGEYINYNEENCISKNASPCSSPWIEQQQFVDFKYSNIISQEQNNSEENVQFNTLPSINQVFSQSFSNYVAQDEFNQDNLFFTSPNFFEDNNTDSLSFKKASINPDNYDYPSNYEVKPNREFKDIWNKDDEKKLINNSLVENNILTKSEELHNVTDEIPMMCCWENCNLTFDNQACFVTHIEKKHVCVKKGDEGMWTCMWTDCSRNCLPFNARYKLLIHMRGKIM
jgi:hypothetical protein